MKTKNNKSPLIYIDNEIYSYSLSNSIPHPTCGGETLRRIKWLKSGHCLTKTISNLLLANVLTPLSNIICYFAFDLGGLYSVLKLLAT